MFILNRAIASCDDRLEESRPRPRLQHVNIKISYIQKELENSHKNLRMTLTEKVHQCITSHIVSAMKGHLSFPLMSLNFITSPVGRAHRHTSLSCKPSLPKTRIARGTDHKKRMIFFIQLLSFYLFIVSPMKEIFVTESFRFYDRETLGCSPLRVIAMKTKKKEKKYIIRCFFVGSLRVNISVLNVIRERCG